MIDSSSTAPGALSNMPDLKVTRERVRQVEAKAIRKLQHPVRARKLEGFPDKMKAGTV